MPNSVLIIFLRSSLSFEGRVIVLKNYLILYKEISDFVVYIVGGADENEMILCEIVNVLCSTLALVIKYAYCAAVLDFLNLSLYLIKEKLHQADFRKNFSPP